MTVVSVSETYDLSTKQNKMSLIAVHTPSSSLIKKTYPGLAINHRFFRFLKCDISLACASMLPADPLQIGTESGQIAPQDMFNPILYKAVTNESLSTIEYRLRGIGEGTYGNSDLTLFGESVKVNDANVDGGADDFGTYYAMLANRDGFAVAHPQQGLVMKGLVPLVHEKLFQYGDNSTFAMGEQNYVSEITGDQAGTGLTIANSAVNLSMKGRAHPMPRMNTLSLHSSSVSDLSSDFGIRLNTTAGEAPVNVAVSDVPDIPRCYVAMIAMPPSKLNLLYYRLVVRWYLSFEDVRPISEIAGFGGDGMGLIGGMFYKSNYVFGSKSEDATDKDLVTGTDVSIEKIMEGS